MSEEMIKKKFDLYDYLTQKVVNYFKKYMTFEELEEEKLYLGVLNVIVNFIKTSIILILAACFSIVKEVLLMILVFALLRLYAAGLHAKKSISCTLTALIAFVGGAYLTLNFPINFRGAFLICVILSLLILKYAPADTENRPIIGPQHRKKLKRNAFIIAVVILVINLILKNVTFINLTMLAMLYQVISILPITYKILKRSYRNYEEYEKEPN